MKSSRSAYASLKKLVLFVAVLFCLGCDPGFTYRPMGWEPISGSRWSKVFGRLEVETDGLRGLTGANSVSPEFNIHNNGNSTVVVKHVELRTTLSREAREPSHNASPEESIAPGAAKRFSWLWMFRSGAESEIGMSPQVVILVEIDSVPTSVVIDFSRE